MNNFKYDQHPNPSTSIPPFSFITKLYEKKSFLILFSFLLFLDLWFLKVLQVPLDSFSELKAIAPWDVALMLIVFSGYNCFWAEFVHWCHHKITHHVYYIFIDKLIISPIQKKFPEIKSLQEDKESVASDCSHYIFENYLEEYALLSKDSYAYEIVKKKKAEKEYSWKNGIFMTSIGILIFTTAFCNSTLFKITETFFSNLNPWVWAHAGLYCFYKSLYMPRKNFACYIPSKTMMQKIHLYLQEQESKIDKEFREKWPNHMMNGLQ